jgi:hypothetical protein
LIGGSTEDFRNLQRLDAAIYIERHPSRSQVLFSSAQVVQQGSQGPSAGAKFDEYVWKCSLVIAIPGQE